MTSENLKFFLRITNVSCIESKMDYNKNHVNWFLFFLLTDGEYMAKDIVTKNNRKWKILAIIGVAVIIFAVFLFMINKWYIEINLNGEQEATVEYGSEWNDPGASATLKSTMFEKVNHAIDINTEGGVDTKKIDTYKITYSAEFLWIKSTKERTVKVKDTTAPVLTLTGDAELTLKYGEEWKDEYKAEDNVDGDITANVQVDGAVDTSTAGEYTLTYTVKDSGGNETKLTRKVTVLEKPIVRDADPGEGKDKVIYLTFDDGPGPYTERLLGILKKRGIKATFFVTDAFSAYRDMIGREAAEGHTVGLHTATHDYSKIYASKAAFWADFDAMQSIITAQTGSPAKITRFPGGSSNTVSISYCPGIMSELAKEVEGKGYVYFDWNVSSGDGSSGTTTESVYKNIIDGIQGKSVSVVLCHDVKESTVDAIDKTIEWCQKSGYTFLPLTNGSYPAHHGIAN